MRYGSAQMESILDRERSAIAAHRAALRGSDLPAPSDAPKGTFLHGFFLPFSLILATLRDRELRGPYVRVLAVRGSIVGFFAIMAIAGGNIEGTKSQRESRNGIRIHKDGKPGKPLKVDLPGLHVDIDEERNQQEVTLLGQKLPVTTIEAPTPDEPPTPSTLGKKVSDGWTWLLGLVAVISVFELMVVFFSRRWDDWLSFHASSRLALILPEDATPATPKLGFDLKWIYRKLKRRVRGYVVFAIGLPLLFPLRMIPVVGPWLFTILATAWGWYWLGVFSAAKSAHAWADHEQALPPAPIRRLTSLPGPSIVIGPLRWYGRRWSSIARSLDPAATTFERSPTAFLGLALARVILALPFVYLLARPIIPVAAGRLCAEADPTARFSIESMPI